MRLRGEAVELTPEDMMSKDALLKKGLTSEEADEILAHQTEHDDPERGEPTPADYR